MAKALLAFFFSTIVLALLCGGCQEPPTETEKTYLDTLYYKLRGNEKALNIDEQSLLARKELIRNKWLPAVQDTAVDIRQKMQFDFQGILTAYDYYLDRHLLYLTSTRLLMEEWEIFKKRSDEGALTRKEFKELYLDLDQRIDDNTQQIEVFAKPVYDIEPMWMRYEVQFKRMGVE